MNIIQYASNKLSISAVGGTAVIIVLLLSPVATAKDLVARKELAKLSVVRQPDGPHRLVVKFRDAVRARTVAGAAVSEARGDLTDIDEIAKRYSATFSPRIKLPQKKLESLEQRAAAHSGIAQPDLGGMLIVEAEKTRLEALAQELNTLEIVEWVYFEELGVPPPCADIAPTTPSYDDQQNYFGPDPGLNMIAARELGSTRGAGVNVADCEYGFVTDHEDLCNIIQESGQTIDPSLTPSFIQHGTAVLGEMVSLDNDYGCTGLIPDATAYFFTEKSQEDGSRRVTAITNAIATVNRGDVVVLEMQTGADPSCDGDDDGVADGDCDGDGSIDYVPAEFNPAVWTVVKAGTDAQVNVVAAAGNGNQDLDSETFQAYRDRGDSGAIIVGAGTSDTNHDKMGFSTFGSRVNVQGWGQNVETLGYDDPMGTGDRRQFYKSTFGGTSSATPMVAACVVSLQSLSMERAGFTMSTQYMRDLLADTGIPQGGGGNIGPLPDMVAASERVGFWMDFAYYGNQTGTFDQPYTALNVGYAMAPSGGRIIIKRGSSSETGVFSKPMTMTAFGGSASIGG